MEWDCIYMKSKNNLVVIICVVFSNILGAQSLDNPVTFRMYKVIIISGANFLPPYHKNINNTRFSHSHGLRVGSSH